MNTISYRRHTHRVGTASRIDPRGLDQIQPMSRAAEQGRVLRTCSPGRARSQGLMREGGSPSSNDVAGGRPAPFCLGANTTCSPSCRAATTTWSRMVSPDGAVIGSVSGILKASNTCQRKGTAQASATARCFPSPHAAEEAGEARISTDLITLAGSRAPPSCGSDKNFISLALPRGADLAGCCAPCVRGLLGAPGALDRQTDQIKILVWVAARAKPFPMRRPRLSISDWTPPPHLDWLVIC